MDKIKAQQIVGQIREIVAEVAPEAVEKSMYGGLVYEVRLHEQKELLCGTFVHKDYVTLELTGGSELADLVGVLEGEGKTRRHIKLYDLADIGNKKIKTYIERSLFAIGSL